MISSTSKRAVFCDLSFEGLVATTDCVLAKTRPQRCAQADSQHAWAKQRPSAVDAQIKCQ